MQSRQVAGDAVTGVVERPGESGMGVGVVAGCFVGGIMAGRWAGAFWVWWGVLAAALIVAGVGMWRGRAGRVAKSGGAGEPGVVRVALLVGVVASGAAWVGARAGGLEPGSLARYVWPDGALAQVEGVVATEPVIVSAERGYFAGYGYEPPPTLFELRVDRVLRDVEAGGPVEAAGTVVVKIEEADLRVRRGQRVRVRGWLGGFMGPSNPGEFDYAAWQAARGVVGRLTVPTRANWDLLAEPGVGAWVSGWGSSFVEGRGWIAARARWSLSLGLTPGTPVTGLLETLLLGETAADIDPLRERFRDVGLAHILSISGAHLGILMGLVWVVARGLTGRPPRAAVVVLAVLVMYLLAIPIRVPVARAAVMAGLYFAGVALGRRPGPTRLLSAAAVIVLIWRPLDLFEPGFQLSFVVVWALLKFTRPVSLWIWPEPVIQPVVPGVGAVLARRAVDYVAVSVVAFLTALPLVAYHFQMVSPLALVLSVLSLPALTAVLAVGYLKVLAGFVLPSVSLVLAGPLRWVGGALGGLVDEAHGWPGAGWALAQPVSAAWAAGCLAVVVAWFGGGFRGRDARWRGGAAVMVVAGWLVVTQTAGRWGGEAPAVVLTMAAVGDGSCYLVQSGGRTLMFDCGSQALPLVGRRSVVPTLKRLGVGRLDVLVLSHADLDHYNGTLDVLDAVPVEQIWVSRDLVEDAAQHHAWSTAHLMRELAARGHTPRVVEAGFTDVLGEAGLTVLWPPPAGAFEAERGNDLSVVLRVDVVGRRLLLNGDIQDDATRVLLRDRAAMDADVADLPHHGSVVDASPAWLAAVSPGIVLQSSGPMRLRRDRWAELLKPHPGVRRYITARDGMVRVEVSREGAVEVTTFRRAERDGGGRHGP